MKDIEETGENNWKYLWGNNSNTQVTIWKYFLKTVISNVIKLKRFIISEKVTKRRPKTYEKATKRRP